jgi:hypothetical protein
MRKLFFLSAFFVLIVSCGMQKEVTIPEGTSDEVANVMKTYNLNYDNSVAFLNALKNQNSLKNVRLSEVVSVMPSVIRGNRVLIVNVSGRSKLYINLD